MRSVIQRIATGPEMSKDISRDEARVAMRAILEGQVDPVQAGIFLIALRMKRETDEENIGILEALREAGETVTAGVDVLIDIADPYDGFTRPSRPHPSCRWCSRLAVCRPSAMGWSASVRSSA